MRPLEYRINLDFANESSDIFCNVRQGDNCSKIVAALREDGRAYDIEGDNLSVVFAALKSDGNTIYDDCTVENNTIIYDFNNQTAPVSGTVPCQFILIDSENGEAKRISTPVFFLEISDNVDIDEENIVSSESYTALTNKIAQAQALINQIQHDLDTGAYKGDPGADGFSPTATVTKSGHTATITITDKNGTTTAEISDGDTAFVNVQLVGSSVYPNIDTATAPNRFYIVFDGSSFYGLLRFSGNVSTGATAISVSQIMYTRTGELLKRIGTTSYGAVTWTGDWTPIAPEGSGVTIINAETVPESANWDDEIPTTYAGQTGEEGELALWNGALWYLYNVATLGQTTYYHWDKVAVTEDLEAKMDLAPLNPTAEQIEDMPNGQLYGDGNNHKGVIKDGQEFYDTFFVNDRLIRIIKNDMEYTRPPAYIPVDSSVNDILRVGNDLFRAGDYGGVWYYQQGTSYVTVDGELTHYYKWKRLLPLRHINNQSLPPELEPFEVFYNYSLDGISVEKVWLSPKYQVGDYYSYNNKWYVCDFAECEFRFVDGVFKGVYVYDWIIMTAPTKISAFTNDSGYLTLETLPIYDGTVI